MLDTSVLVTSGEHITMLDEEALASIVGGDWKTWIANKVGTLLTDCIFGGLDDLIDAAKEGYEDAR
jgi:hypothetical protein